jgi:hypothetical protein
MRNLQRRTRITGFNISELSAIGGPASGWRILYESTNGG